MKKRISMLAVCLAPIFLNAQATQGVVTFVETVQMKIDFGDDPQAESMKKLMPASRSFKNALYFTETESLYRDVETADGQPDEISHQEEGMNFQINMKRPETRIYHHFDSETVLESREFFGRQFLIDDKMQERSWKIAPEQKQILGYACQKAVLQDTSKNLVVWFTAQIPAPAGPSNLCGLPGLVLEVNQNNGELTMLAEKIDLKPLEAGALEKPSKGKKVTREEFKKIQDEKLKEMGVENGGGGGGPVRVIIRN